MRGRRWRTWIGFALLLSAVACTRQAPAPARKMLLLTPSTIDTPEGLSLLVFHEELRKAAASWSYPASPCTSLDISVDEPRPKRRAEQDDLSVVVFRGSRWCHNERCGAGSTFPISAAAMTTTYPSPGKHGRIVDADIELNAVGFAWHEGDSSKPLAPLGSVLLHEIGHALGFADVCVDEPCSEDEMKSVMKSGARATKPTPWDVEKLCKAFPR